MTTDSPFGARLALFREKLRRVPVCLERLGYVPAGESVKDYERLALHGCAFRSPSGDTEVLFQLMEWRPPAKDQDQVVVAIRNLKRRDRFDVSVFMDHYRLPYPGLAKARMEEEGAFPAWLEARIGRYEAALSDYLQDILAEKLWPNVEALFPPEPVTDPDVLELFGDLLSNDSKNKQ